MNSNNDGLLKKSRIGSGSNRHSGESRNPVPKISGCRIKSGMTNSDFLRDHQSFNDKISNWLKLTFLAIDDQIET
jgi:hypothetical protein